MLQHYILIVSCFPPHPTSHTFLYNSVNLLLSTIKNMMITTHTHMLHYLWSSTCACTLSAHAIMRFWLDSCLWCLLMKLHWFKITVVVRCCRLLWLLSISVRVLTVINMIDYNGFILHSITTLYNPWYYCTCTSYGTTVHSTLYSCKWVIICDGRW